MDGCRNERKLDGKARPEDPFGYVGKALGMTQHELMHVQESEQHEHNASGRNPPGCWYEQSYASEEFGPSGQLYQRLGMRVMVRHDAQVKRRMPKVIDPARDV